MNSLSWHQFVLTSAFTGLIMHCLTNWSYWFEISMATRWWSRKRIVESLQQVMGYWYPRFFRLHNAAWYIPMLWFDYIYVCICMYMYIYIWLKVCIGRSFLRLFFGAKILQHMPCAAIFFKHYIPWIKWHHFVQSPYVNKELQHFFERNIRLFLKRLTV